MTLRKNIDKTLLIAWLLWIPKYLYSSLFSSSSSFEGYPLQVRHKQDWGRGFILLLHQTVALPGSDAGSDVINPESSLANCTK